MPLQFPRPSSEAEMIAEFLRQEYASRDRHGARLDASLHQEGIRPVRITDPDLSDPVQTDERRRVFARYRGYGTGSPSYLTDFPSTGVKWSWVSITPEELLDSRYIRYEYWTELSAGTRSPRVAAQRILAGQTAPVADTPRYLDLAAKLRAGLQVPPIILVSADGGKTRVILEGHTRITAFALAPETIPDPLDVILGMSPEIARWDEY
jgi:hypothetical protein